MTIPNEPSEDFARARSTSDFPEITAALQAGRPLAIAAQYLVSRRLDLDLLEQLRALGPGWQARLSVKPRKVAGI